MKIYHNPKCSKSRQTLALIQEKGKEVKIIEYLKTPLTFEDLELILVKLGVSPIQLVRTKEEIWITNYKGKEMTDDDIITALVDNPKIMERPIVVKASKAVIGRPPENVLKLFS